MKVLIRRVAPWAVAVALVIGGTQPSFAASARRAAILTSGPCAGVAVNLDFAAQAGQGLYCLNGQRYGSFQAVPGASFTRASVGTAVDSAGKFVTFGSGVPRITDLGLLVEESRTNLLLWSQAFDNAAWAANFAGTGSAPVVTANAALAPDGTMTADQVMFNVGSGTTSMDISAIQQVVAASNATAYAGSFWINCGAGLRLSFRHAAALNYNLIDCTGAWQRVSSVEISGTTAATMQIGIRQGTNLGALSPSATVYLWQADLQQGVTVLSAIPTTSIVAVLSGSAPPTDSYSMYVRGTYPTWVTGSPMFAEGAAALGGPLNGASFALSSALGYLRLQQRSGAARGDTDGQGPAFVAGDKASMGVSTDGTTARFSVNGVTIASQGTVSQADWSGIISIGARQSGGAVQGQAFTNTYIQRVVIYGATDSPAIMNLRTAQ
jgi:hypothetical protein